MADTLEHFKTLSVVALRKELDKRGLVKSGLKLDLIKRLEKSIVESSVTKNNDDKGDSSSTEAKDVKMNGDDTKVDDVKIDCIKKSVSVEKKEIGKDDSIEKNVVIIGKDDSIEKNVVIIGKDDALEKNGNEKGPVEVNSVDSTIDSSVDSSIPDSETPLKNDVVEPNPSNEQPPTPLDEQTDKLKSDLQNGHANSTSATPGSPLTEVEMPESDLTSKQADSTTSDQQKNDGQQEKVDVPNNNSSADSTSNEIENDYVECEKTAQSDDEKVASENINELPEDERVNTNTVNNVIVIDDDAQDEEMAEEDQAVSIEIIDELQDEFNESTGEMGKTEMETENVEEDQGDEVIERSVPSDQSDIVVIDDDNDEATGDNDGISETEKSKNTVSKKISHKKSSSKQVINKSSSSRKKDTVENGKSKQSGMKERDIKTSTSGTNESSSKSIKTSSRSHKSTSKEIKTEDTSKQKDLSKSLWICGLSSVTKAVDLKEIFGQYGKVMGAKVVTSAKAPGLECFGFITMSSIEESSTCIEKLHKTVLHEKTIEVDQAKTDPTPVKKPPLKSSKSGDRKEEEKSHSSHHTSRSGMSRSSRHDDHHSSHRSHERKRDSDRKHGDKAREKSDSKTTKVTSLKSSTSASKDSSKESKPTKVVIKSRSGSKEGDESDDVVVIEDESKTEEKKTSKKDTKKGEKAVLEEGTENNIEKETEENKEEGEDIKALDKLKKEKADKSERERKLREERKKKEREREQQLREEIRRDKEKREKEHQERVRKEAERSRREREKQRELEKDRERERRKEKEHYIRERREREEKERKEHEQLERERHERERHERERRERERHERECRERERHERECLEDERLHNERIVREDSDFRMEQERLQLEIDELEQKCVETERHAGMVNRGLATKRPMPGEDNRREYHPDQKRSLHDASPQMRKDFFSPGNRNDSASAMYGNERTYDIGDHNRNNNSYNRANKVEDIHEPRSSRNNPRPTTTRHDVHSNTREHATVKERLGYNHQSSDIRDSQGRSYNRDRSPHRTSDIVSKYHDVSRNQIVLSAPKTLSDVLGRAGLTGILGSRAEEKQTYDVSSSRSGDRFYSSGNHSNQDSSRGTDRSHNTSTVVDYREQHRVRVDSRDIRDTQTDKYQINKRVDEGLGNTSRYDDPYRQDDKQIEGEARGASNAGVLNNSNIINQQNLNRTGLHPLASSVIPAIAQPRVLPITDIFGRPLQVVQANTAQALQASYVAAATQGLALQNIGRTGIQLNRTGIQLNQSGRTGIQLNQSGRTGIQLNQSGQLEFTRMAQTNIALNRRF